MPTLRLKRTASTPEYQKTQIKLTYYILGETKPVEKAIGIPIITATAKATATTAPAPII